jgi:uncharacterized protein YycO
MVVTPLIIAGILIAGVWAYYLIPSMVGARRDAPLSSAAQFDRLTRMMADVQRDQYDARRSSERSRVLVRRRRTIVIAGLLAVASLGMAWRFQSMNWLLAHLAVDVLIAWYVAMLMQLRQQRAVRTAERYFGDSEAGDDFPVKVIANQR